MSEWSRNVPGIESVIEGSNKLTEIFGYWPTFHDAEVIDAHLWRGDVDPSTVAPMLMTVEEVAILLRRAARRSTRWLNVDSFRASRASVVVC